MNNILTAITTKLSGSDFLSDVGGRVFIDEYPADEQPATYPYAIFFIVSGVPDDVFNKKGRDILMQFSLFSASKGLTEITNMYNDLHSLFDDCTFSITSNTLIWMHEENLTTMMDKLTINNAAQTVKHWAVDYSLITRAA